MFDSLLDVRAKIWIKKEGKYTLFEDIKIDVQQQPVSKKGVKDDNDVVPTYLWLRWLNDGDSKVITVEQWDNFISVLQDKLLLLRWRRNLTRSFWKWFSNKHISQVKRVEGLVNLVD